MTAQQKMIGLLFQSFCTLFCARNALGIHKRTRGEPPTQCVHEASAGSWLASGGPVRSRPAPAP